MISHIDFKNGLLAAAEKRCVKACASKSPMFGWRVNIHPVHIRWTMYDSKTMDVDLYHETRIHRLKVDPRKLDYDHLLFLMLQIAEYHIQNQANKYVQSLEALRLSTDGQSVERH